MNKLAKWLLKDQEDAVTRNNQKSMMMSAAATHIQAQEDEQSQWGGSSSDGHKYVSRDQEIMDQRLKAQYFTDPCSLNQTYFIGDLECNIGSSIG